MCSCAAILVFLYRWFLKQRCDSGCVKIWKYIGFVPCMKCTAWRSFCHLSGPKKTVPVALSRVPAIFGFAALYTCERNKSDRSSLVLYTYCVANIYKSRPEEKKNSRLLMLQNSPWVGSQCAHRPLWDGSCDTSWCHSGLYFWCCNQK